MLNRIWTFCCSLKLAIYLASATTLLLMGGSLLVPANRLIFGAMDQMTLGDWFMRIAANQPLKTWWFYLGALTMILFGLNTLCCFFDWLWNLRARWRKSGEYLLHLGVVLLLIAYIWGNTAGWRNHGLQCQVGGLTPLPDWPGHYLRVDSFSPVFNDNGPPRDMISEVSLLKGDTVLLHGRVRINQPLLHAGLVITPVSFGRQPIGFRALIAGIAPIEMTPGRHIELADGAQLKVLRFLPDARRQQNGEILYRSDRLGNAAFELYYRGATGRIWQGWYFVDLPLPIGLAAQGLKLRPIAPLFESYSALTVNYDPGARLAAIGISLVTVGVLLALFSFYRKRRNQDRPQIN